MLVIEYQIGRTWPSGTREQQTLRLTVDALSLTDWSRSRGLVGSEIRSRITAMHPGWALMGYVLVQGSYSGGDMLKKVGINGEGETHWVFKIPEERLVPGIEIGIKATEVGLEIGDSVIDWGDLNQAMMEAQRKLPL